MLEAKDEFAHRRIAVVDDNRNFRELMRVMLRSFGVRRVDLFANATDVFPFLGQNHIDLIFIDHLLGGLSGLELASMLRHSPKVLNRSMPIALVTGMTSRRVVMGSVTAGIDTVIAKPVSPRIVFDRTRALLARPARYVSGPNHYFGPNVVERRSSIEGRLERGRVWPVRGERARPEPMARPVAAPVVPDVRQPRTATVTEPGFAALKPTVDAFMLD